MREPERLNLRGDIGATLLRAGRREAPPESSRRRATVLVGAMFASVAAPSAAAASAVVPATGVEAGPGGGAVSGAGPSVVAATTAGSGAALAMNAVVVIVALGIGAAAALSFSRGTVRAGSSEVAAPTLAALPALPPSVLPPSASPAPVLVAPTVAPAVTPRTPTQASAPSFVPAAPLSSGTAQPGLADEVVALRDAQQTLAGGMPDEALRRLDVFHHDFPRPHLAPEADALLIEALHARGDVAGARSFLAAFRTKYPESPLLEHLDAVVGR